MNLSIKLLVVVALFNTSCEKEFILNPPESDKLIVINSIFNNSEVLSASVTETLVVQQNDVVELTNAKVSLFENDNFIENLVYSKKEGEEIGQFYSSIIPQLGATYKLEVENVNNKKVIAESELPSEVFLESGLATWIVWSTPEDTSFIIRYYFEIDFTDPAEDNYYYITASLPVYKKDTINNTRSFDSWQYAEILTGDLPNHQIYINNALLFKDGTFNNGYKKITGTVTTSSQPDVFYYDDDPINELDKTKMRFQLHTLSKDAYNFCSSYARKIAAQDDLYSEPIVIFTNVENGLGLFAGESISNVEVPIKY